MSEIDPGMTTCYRISKSPKSLVRSARCHKIFMNAVVGTVPASVGVGPEGTSYGNWPCGDVGLPSVS
jgi:hypothetical protein